MRIKTTLASAIMLTSITTACGGVELRRGLPLITKQQTTGALVAGTDGWADLNRGNLARNAGRLDDAVRDLEPLARRGYADAMLALASTHNLRNQPNSEADAINWYRKALPTRPQALVPLARGLILSGKPPALIEARALLNRRLGQQDDPQAVAALLDLHGLYPALDTGNTAPAMAAKAGRSDVVELRIAAISWTRDAVIDRTSATRLINLCRRNLAIAPECHVDLAGYYRYRGDQKGLAATVDAALAAFETLVPLTAAQRLTRTPVDIAQIAGRFAITLVEQRQNEDLLDADQEATALNTAARMVRADLSERTIGTRDRGEAPPQMMMIAATAPPVAAPKATAAPLLRGVAEPELANKVLRWMLARGPTMSVEAAGVAVAYPYLLPDVDLVTLLKSGVADGNPRASLLLGDLYFFDQRLPREAALAELNLKQALTTRTTRLPAHYRLGRLYQQGYLGEPDPARSRDNFLVAARGRVSAADQHLARLFYNSPGTRTNRVNAYVFARLSQDAGNPVEIRTLRNGTPEGYNLLSRLSTDLTADELRTAQSLYERERRVHRIARPVIGQQIWAMPDTSGVAETAGIAR